MKIDITKFLSTQPRQTPASALAQIAETGGR